MKDDLVRYYWERGMDTLDIARTLQWRECDVERRLHEILNEKHSEQLQAPVKVTA